MGRSSMSRQRPYGTFEEGYVIQILDRIPEDFDDFILITILNEKRINENPVWKQIGFPFIFEDSPLIEEYWYGLCRMYGEIFEDKDANYILAENFRLLVDHLIDIVHSLFPPTWNYSDEPIISFDEIKFIA